MDSMCMGRWRCGRRRRRGRHHVVERAERAGRGERVAGPPPHADGGAPLPREVLRFHDIIASGGIEWAHQAAAAFAEAAAREFDSSAFAGVPANPDLEWLHGCVDYLVRRDV